MADLDLSILNRVKKRLYGDDNQDTQVIPDFQNSILFTSTQPVGSEKTDNDEKSATDETSRVKEAIRLPQLALDDVEFAKPVASTQIIACVLKPTQQSEDLTLTREEKLARLVERKRQERLLEEQQLEAEIAHPSLTDEENDLNDAADTTCDSSVQKNMTTKKELEQIDRFLSEQKRNRTIQPAFQKRDVDPVKQLVSAFDSDSEPEETINSEKNLKLSPTTSPMKVSADKGETNLDSDSDFDTTNVLDMIANPQLPMVKAKKNPINEYAQRLKKQMLSSPTRSDGVIALDDSGDDTAVESNAADVPKLTKEQQFLLKQRYSRKKLQRIKQSNAYSKFHQPRAREKGMKLFNELRLANAKQLNELKESNPDAELLEEIEKEEEEMGNLLEREMERVRRIRKKEKLQEKAKLALLNGDNEDNEDADYKDQDDQDEVPESDINSGESEFDDDVSDSELELEADTEKITRSKRVVLSEDEESDDQANGPQDSVVKRHDDSYMFGVASDEVDRDEDVMQIQAGGNQSPSLKVLDHTIDQTDSNSHELFLNLAPRKESDISFNTSIVEDSLPAVTEAPSFLDISDTQDTNVDLNLPTQADTQPIDTSEEPLVGESTQADLYSDEEDDLPTAVSKGRKLISKNALQSVRELDEEQEEVDEQKEQELLKERLALYEAKIRRKELKARRLRKEMERKGIKNVVEGEAEESEDEWKGIGGADDEDSDPANSEDERMIDNNFNIDLNDEEVRKKFMEQYQIKDRKELEKLIDDVKNHKLTRRARANRFDIELSDEEDELLMAYRRQKLAEQKQRLLNNQKLMKLAQNEKSRAFFESIQDEATSIELDEELEESDSSSTPEPKSATKNNIQETEADEEEPTSLKKVIRIEEAFVQKQLSFLSKTEDDDYYEIQRVSNKQHGVISDDDIEDLSTLKSRSLSNLYTKSATPELVDTSNKRKHVDVETDDDEDDDCFTHLFKKPSVVGSFRTFQEKQGVQVSSKSFSGVTVNKQYKVASGSKASITYLSKASRQKHNVTSVYQSSKAKEIEESIGRAHRESSANGLFRSGGTFS